MAMQEDGQNQTAPESSEALALGTHSDELHMFVEFWGIARFTCMRPKSFVPQRADPGLVFGNSLNQFQPRWASQLMLSLPLVVY